MSIAEMMSSGQRCRFLMLCVGWSKRKKSISGANGLATEMKQRVYLDTSVIGGCKDDEFSEWSLCLFEEFQQNLKIAVVSDLTRKELEKAPEEIKNILKLLPGDCIEDVFFNREAELLAQNYIDHGVAGKQHIIDAQHIAIASVEKVPTYW